MTIVSNSSPLILLSRVGLFHLLRKLFAQIYIPKQVHKEIVTAGKGRPGSQEVREASWIKIEEVTDQSLIEQFEVKNLSRKDAAVIALAKQKKADAVLLRIPLLMKQPGVVGLGLCPQPKRNGTEAIPYIRFFNHRNAQ